MKKIANNAVLATIIWSAVAGSLMPIDAAFAQTNAYKQLSEQWWQWVLSIPADENPLLDPTGASFTLIGGDALCRAPGLCVWVCTDNTHCHLVCTN
jgi:hypothetical protein